MKDRKPKKAKINNKKPGVVGNSKSKAKPDAAKIAKAHKAGAWSR